jgi:hypothetical protein
LICGSGYLRERGKAAAIDARVTGNTARIRMVVNEWTRLAGDPRRARALVFCVTVRHARFVAEQLTDSGIPALAVTGETPRSEQLRAPHRLARGEVCALVTVDLYNEGVDIPEVDTLILLRPTQSPVLFQQQIGRGLRLVQGKESCLILDLVGQHRVEFRFDRLLSAITGLSRRRLIDGVEHGFTDLAPGCHIHLQPQTRGQVLRSLRSLTQQSWSRLVAEVQAFASLRGVTNVELGEFLAEQRVEMDEVYRGSRRSGWTTLRRDAGLLQGGANENEMNLSRRLSALLHVDDGAYLRTISNVADNVTTWTFQSEADRIRAQMLTYQVLGAAGSRGAQLLRERLVEYSACADELVQLANVLMARSRLDPLAILGMEDVPLHLHSAYHVREILTAVGFLRENRYVPFQAGVLALHERNLELLFVTLDKSAGFHDGISYHDYAISPGRFHWQTQNTAGFHTPAGRRYVESATNSWTFRLFVRPRKGGPYRACGPVRLDDRADVTGDRPLSITWTLEVPLPPKLFGEFNILRG